MQMFTKCIHPCPSSTVSRPSYLPLNSVQTLFLCSMHCDVTFLPFLSQFSPILEESSQVLPPEVISNLFMSLITGELLLFSSRDDQILFISLLDTLFLPPLTGIHQGEWSMLLCQILEKFNDLRIGTFFLFILFFKILSNSLSMR